MVLNPVNFAKGVDVCTFSTSTSGNHLVPSPGCQLNQVVVLGETTMTVTGTENADPLDELRAMGGEPSQGVPHRHFELRAETTTPGSLTLSHLQLTGGRIWVESQSRGSVGDAGGGSIWVVGASARFTATNVLFLGCNDLYCSKGGGAIYVDSGAEIIISDSTFRNNKATWTAGGCVGDRGADRADRPARPPPSTTTSLRKTDAPRT